MPTNEINCKSKYKLYRYFLNPAEVYFLKGLRISSLRYDSNSNSKSDLDSDHFKSFKSISPPPHTDEKLIAKAVHYDLKPIKSQLIKSKL